MTHPGLKLTRPYPFARLKALFEGINPAGGALKPISLGMGEPRHALPESISKVLCENTHLLSHYPTTNGDIKLREAISSWCGRRYGLTPDPATEVLPVLGTREALFSFAQSVLDPTAGNAKVLIPTPFYQIYEGAAFLAGAEPVYMPLSPENGFMPDFSALPEETLQAAQLLYVCSPGNPTGAVIGLEKWKEIFELSDRYGFVIASDECYSEIYFEEGKAPMGAFEAARILGRGLKNLVIFQSLSKRSNAPGLRSGFVAGDSALIKPFLLYRTYHGSAMSPMVQTASIAAWNDETHVVENRRLYREKFAAAHPVINELLDAPMPQASFYLWTKVPGSDEAFAQGLYREKAVTVLPGSYLSRPAPDASGKIVNAGEGYVRIALVAEPEEVNEAAARVRDYAASLK